VIIGYGLGVHGVADRTGIGGAALASRLMWLLRPACHFKAPFIDTVIPVDKRILDLENPSAGKSSPPIRRRLVGPTPLRATAIKERVAVLSERRLDPVPPTIQLTTAFERGRCAACSARVTFIQVGARRARSPDGGGIRDQLDHEAGGLRHPGGRWCGSGAPICPETEQPGSLTSACRPSGSAEGPPKFRAQGGQKAQGNQVQRRS